MSEFMYTELSTVKAYNGKLFFAYIESPLSPVALNWNNKALFELHRLFKVNSSEVTTFFSFCQSPKI